MNTARPYYSLPLFAALLVFILLISTLPQQAKAVEITVDLQEPQFFSPKDCLECHSDIDGKKFIQSVHGGGSCICCHRDLIDLERHAKGVYKPLRVDCVRCHIKEGKLYESSYHKTEQGMTCTDCHTDPHVFQKVENKRIGTINKCSECHDTNKYVESGHAGAALKGNRDSAICSDCHGLHDTVLLHTDMDKYPEEARTFYNKACMRCHGDKEMMQRNEMTTTAVDTYEKTYHGKVQKLGYPTHVAGCADCHLSHKILPASDPESTIHPSNLINNCGRCHKEANANFVQYRPHADYHSKDRHPLLYWTFVLMTGLLAGTFAVFWLHTGLWWRKTYWEKHQLKSEGFICNPEYLNLEKPGEYFQRFSIAGRVMHVVLIVSFLSLVITGMPLKFADEAWAHWLMGQMGGAHMAGMLHRFFAAVLIVLFTGALVMSIRFLFNKKYGATVTERLFGPDSLFPRKKDLSDFAGMMRWFLGTGEQPKFDRWTYWEKFDFLAVFWGMFAIGLSGMALWLPEMTSKFLPGWVFNVAHIVHSDEALLAAGFIFTVHFFNTHFIPTKFPMDPVIFTGRIEKYKFLEEKQLHYERLQKEGTLEKMKTGAPDIILSLLSGIFGFASLALGLLLTVAIAYSLLT